MKRLFFSFAAPYYYVAVAFGLLTKPAPAAAQAPTWQWGLQTTNPTPTDRSPATGQGVATDAAGNVYVGGDYGTSTSTATPTGNVTRSFGSAGSVGPGRGGFVAQATAAGQWAWVTAATPTGTDPQGFSSLSVSDVAVTATGDVYATGYVHGTSLQIGSVTQALSARGEALFVARLNSSGGCQWLRTVDYDAATTTAQIADIDARLAADPSTGGVVLVGTSYGSLVLGSTTLPTTAPGKNALFVARLSTGGQWLSATSAMGTANVNGPEVSVGPTGQVAVTTSQSPGTLTFGSITLTVPAGAEANYVVAQLSPANQWQWALGGAGSATSGLTGAAYTPTGTLWIAGQGENGTVVGTTTLVVPVGTPPTLNATGFVGQLSATGQWTTVRQLTLSSDGNAVLALPRIDAAGNVVMIGALVGRNGSIQATTSGGQVLTSPSAGPLFFTASLSSTGQWNNATPVPQSTLPGGLNPSATALDGSGNLYLTGGLSGGLTLGSSVLTGTSGSRGSDVVLGKLSRATALAARSATKALALACFPNPATTRATLRLPATATAATLATLTDALGRPVRTCVVPARATEATLELGGLAPGLYSVRCGTANGQLVVE